MDQRRADAFSDVFASILTNRPPRRDGAAAPARARRHHGVTVAAPPWPASTRTRGYLDSFGPITARMARELAQDGTWRRLLTDPHRAGREVGTAVYRPGTDLTRTVIARDIPARSPDVANPPTRGDLDHIIPFDPSRPAALKPP